MLTKEFDYNEKIYTREPVETILNFWKKKEDIKTFEKVEHFKYKNEEEFLKEMTEFIEEKKDNIINVITLEELKSGYETGTCWVAHWGRFLICYEEGKTNE